MDKYCTFITRIKARRSRFGTHRICGQSAVTPHPLIPNNSLCSEHRDAVQRLIRAMLATMRKQNPSRSSANG